jgi:uncharacterized protein (DUF1330 family)
MRSKSVYASSALAILSFGSGAFVTEVLHAQKAPPAFYIAEVDVSNPEAYAKEFGAKSQAATKAAGGRYLSLGGRVVPLEGDPPKARIALQQWDSMDKLLAFFNSAENKQLRQTGAKYAKFRTFAVEGLPQ